MSESTKSPEMLASEVKAEGFKSAAMKTALTSITTDADRQRFLGGLMDIVTTTETADGAKVTVAAEVKDRVVRSLEQSLEETAYAGAQRIEGTATQTQLDDVNARHSQLRETLQQWTNALTTVLQNVTVEPAKNEERREYPTPVEGWKDSGIGSHD
jgi:hypothetical protein